MEFNQIGYVAACALVCSFFAGLMGIGGGVLMAPLLLLAPTLWPGLLFPVSLIAGITATQDLVGSLSAAFAHRRYNFQSRTLLLHMCSFVFTGALIGSALSSYVRGEIILIVLAILVTVGTVCMLTLNLKSQQRDSVHAHFSKVSASIVALIIGMLAGFVGQGSAFILIPAMLLILKLPLRVTVANSLGIVFCAALGALLGRWSTHQFSGWWLLILLTVAIPASQAGAHISSRISQRRLEQLMKALLVAASVELWFKLLT